MVWKGDKKMSRNIFGWDLPPGVTDSMLPGSEDFPCDICGGFSNADECICPECPECGSYGDTLCYEKHGLVRTQEQKQIEQLSQKKWENNKKIVLDGTFKCPGCGFREKHLVKCSRGEDV